MTWGDLAIFACGIVFGYCWRVVLVDGWIKTDREGES